MSNLIKRPYLDPWLKDFFDVESMFPSKWKTSAANAFPAVNISETDKEFNVEVVAPGYKKDDFKVNVEDDILTISAESKSETTEEGNGKQYSRREYNFNAFTRSFRLPENAKDDAISASYNEGILALNIPKTETEIKVKKEIQVN
jgi:HSP20 family protein